MKGHENTFSSNDNENPAGPGGGAPGEKPAIPGTSARRDGKCVESMKIIHLPVKKSRIRRREGVKNYEIEDAVSRNSKI
ncbi:hypothetical protein AALC17_02405 [Oscillospiraceae bacterium 38-13]